MRQIITGIYIGSQEDCRKSTDNMAVIHACKTPCHQQAVGYTGNLPKEHENYLVYERGSDLYLNMIDPKIPLFMPESFLAFRKFAKDAWDKGHQLLIHCNQSHSRAPSLALIFMSKDLGVIDSTSYEAARAEFEQIDSEYLPGKGIETFLKANWTTI